MANHKNNSTCATMIAPVVVLLSAAPALAQQSDDEGGFQANVGLHFDRNNNIYDSSTQEVESWITRVSPDLLLRSTPGKRQFSAQYVGDYGRFLDGLDSADDYADHSLTGRGLFKMGSRGALDVSAVFARGHEDRGSGQTQGVPPSSPLFPDEPDVFERIDVSVEHSWGVRQEFGFFGDPGPGRDEKKVRPQRVDLGPGVGLVRLGDCLDTDERCDANRDAKCGERSPQLPTRQSAQRMEDDVDET